MLHLQYGIQSLSKFATARRLPLERNVKIYYFPPAYSQTRASPTFHLATTRASADHARVINDFYRAMLCIRGTITMGLCPSVSVCVCVCHKSEFY